MQNVLLVVHLLVSVILVGLILLQSGKGGLGRAFGGDIVYRSKRGAERIVFIGTFIAAFLFFLTSIANILLR
jgi:preprotein translocase subunit SecG